jgi:hypothetical protein
MKQSIHLNFLNAVEPSITLRHSFGCSSIWLTSPYFADPAFNKLHIVLSSDSITVRAHVGDTFNSSECIPAVVSSNIDSLDFRDAWERSRVLEKIANAKKIGGGGFEQG